MICRPTGSALPIVLMLLTILSLFAANALRTATAEARLTDSLLVADRAFELGERGIAAGLRYAFENPANLTTGLPLALRLAGPDADDTVEVSLAHTVLDNYCPAMSVSPVERLHFEIRAMVHVELLRQTHVQGFYICREICPGPCTGIESLPVRSYWTVHGEGRGGI
ncbi:MAG: hypothetical protein QF790_02485 [Gammaproteobacteria bacterium]|jgi:hypothetical protein|nr:hypothetical protein [Gammaproteobacteria bacterium]MDP6616017.1 hypothetical protein [Gammaproteobacteria bacterium]MDP6695145.1 hypothetical protein [Gammaproteobacteria bacterium]